MSFLKAGDFMRTFPKKSGRHSKLSEGGLFAHSTVQAAFVRTVTPPPPSYILHKGILLISLFFIVKQ